MILRQAMASDADAICAITNAVIRDTLVTFTTELRRPDQITDQIMRRGAAFQVAELDGEPIGFATYFPFRDGPGYAHTREHSIQLTRLARGKGVGRALMQRLETAAINDGVHALIGGISSANPGSISFHQRLGYAEVARMPEVGRKNGQWLDLILMQKLLPGETIPDSDTRAG